MPFNWSVLFRVISAVLSAVAQLPADYDHRSIARALADLIALFAAGPPAQDRNSLDETDNHSSIK
jgi:hypothetical protein